MRCYFFSGMPLTGNSGKLTVRYEPNANPISPVVLSREEIDMIVANLKYPYDLVVKLLYGCGLRLSECLNLCIQSFNFEFSILTVHDGEEKKGPHCTAATSHYAGV
jgi:integrase